MVKTSSELTMKTAKLMTRRGEKVKQNNIDRIYNRYKDSSVMNDSKGNSYKMFMKFVVLLVKFNIREDCISMFVQTYNMLSFAGFSGAKLEDLQEFLNNMKTM